VFPLRIKNNIKLIPKLFPKLDFKILVSLYTFGLSQSSALGLGWVAHEPLERARAQVVLHERGLHERLVPAAEQSPRQMQRCRSIDPAQMWPKRRRALLQAVDLRLEPRELVLERRLELGVRRQRRRITRAHLPRATPKLGCGRAVPGSAICGQEEWAQSQRRCGKCTEARPRTLSRPMFLTACRWRVHRPEGTCACAAGHGHTRVESARR
jgi:hypothetical protein